MTTEAFVVSFAATLFSMMNPIGSLGIFASLTANRTDSEAKRIAITSGLAVAITLLIVNWIGKYFLSFFGISIPTLQVAGGIIVLIIGLNMLFNKSDHKTSDSELADSQDRESIAIVPLAIPIVAGPGTMAAVLVASSHHAADLAKMEMSIVIVGMSILTGVLFYFARPVSKLLGKSAMGVITRVMGLVLASIAMGLFADGLKSLFPGLA